jgi:hypothetical protein
MDFFAPPSDHFTRVDTMNTSNYLRAVITPDLTGTLHFLMPVMPVTGFDLNGQPVTPSGFGKDYGLYLTIEGSFIANPNGSAKTYTSLDMTLWADPRNNDGTPSVSLTSDPSFSNGQTNDIVLATGEMVSASMGINPSTGVRSADFVDSMTPTLSGTLLLGGSLRPGDQLEVKATTLPTEYVSDPQAGGGFINTVTDGTTQITLDPQEPFLVPDITLSHLQLPRNLVFMHGHHDPHRNDDGGSR